MNEKPNLLLLHGAIGSTKQFLELKKSLIDYFNVFDLNFEGHGGSVSNSDFSIQLFTQNIIDWMVENKIDRINVFGYSMGGYVALNLASKYPELIETIVTLGTKFNWTPEIAEREQKMLNPEIIQAKIPKFADKLKQDHAPADWKEVLNKTAIMMINLGNGVGIEKKAFEEITTRVIIGIGTEDKMVTLEESKDVASLLSNARCIELLGIPHPIDQINGEMLANFIKESITGKEFTWNSN